MVLTAVRRLYYSQRECECGNRLWAILNKYARICKDRMKSCTLWSFWYQSWESSLIPTEYETAVLNATKHSALYRRMPTNERFCFMLEDLNHTITVVTYIGFHLPITNGGLLLDTSLLFTVLHSLFLCPLPVVQLLLILHKTLIHLQHK